MLYDNSYKPTKTNRRSLLWQHRRPCRGNRLGKRLRPDRERTFIHLPEAGRERESEERSVQREAVV